MTWGTCDVFGKKRKQIKRLYYGAMVLVGFQAVLMNLVCPANLFPIKDIPELL